MLFSNSLGTPSGPGLLLFFNFLMTVLKVFSLMTSGSRVVYSVRSAVAGDASVKGSTSRAVVVSNGRGSWVFNEGSTAHSF